MSRVRNPFGHRRSRLRGRCVQSDDEDSFVHQGTPIDVCPDNYHIVYTDEPVDDRECNECACGAPIGSACIGKTRLYDAPTCSNVLLGSMGEGCTNRNA